jgi:hypothetical protein
MTRERQDSADLQSTQRIHFSAKIKVRKIFGSIASTAGYCDVQRHISNGFPALTGAASGLFWSCHAWD